MTSRVISLLAFTILMAFPAAIGHADGCCRVEYMRCRPNNPNIPCQHCVDGNCTEKARIYSNFTVCECSYSSGDSGCVSAAMIYCAYEYNCIEIPAGCGNPSLKFCEPDYDNPIPFIPYGSGPSSTTAAGICSL